VPAFQNDIARRLAPAKPARAETPVGEPEPAPEVPEDGRSALQRLVDRFR
jgi:hypothetical protein